jgi:hypothetical protein
VSKPISDKQLQLIKEVEKSLGIKFKGESTAQGAFLFLQEHMPKMKQPQKKPMSKKQKEAVEAVCEVLKIKYRGDNTAQGAFLFLNKHIGSAQKKVAKMIAEERINSIPRRPMFYDNSRDEAILERMEFYRFDNAEHELGDEDTTYAETPTHESLSHDIGYYMRFL